MKPKLSIVIPNYNEKENIESGCLDQVRKYLKTFPHSWEVLISDDGSTDGSRDLVASFVRKHTGFTLIDNPHGGKAAAVLSGIKAAKGEIVLFTDMDQSTPLKEVEKLLPWYDQGFDVVFGSRGTDRKNFPLTRKIMSFFFKIFRQTFLLPKVRDTQCGFKSFRAPIAKKLFPKLSVLRQKAVGWTVSAFDVELLFLAEKAGYQLKEVDVEWENQDQSTGKSQDFLNQSLDMLKQIFSVKINDLKGLYK